MLNYSALTNPLLPQDIEAFRLANPGPSLAFKVVMAVIGGALGAIVVLSLFAAAMASRSAVGFILPTVITAIVAGGVILGVLSNRVMTRINARLHKFAAQNGAIFTLKQDNPPEVGVIFGTGSDRSAYSIVDFPSGLRVASYRYSTGSGKNRQTHVWSYARMKLERHVPNMMIDAKSNNLFRKFTNLPGGYAKGQVQNIQPEFDALYTLYAPENYELDSFYLLTPDVLAALIDARGYFDIEVVDDNMYFYSQSRIDFSKKESWDRLLSVVAPVAKEFQEQADYYADAKAGVPRSADIIAPEGRRLRRGVAVSTIFVILFGVAYAVFTFVSGLR